MTERMQSLDVVRAIYEAFRQGDLGAIGERVTDVTSWDFSVKDSDVPWHAPVSGRAALPAFFAAFSGNVELTAFEPTMVVGDGHHVVARVHVAYTVKRTGKRVDMEQIHLWTFEGDRVAALRHFEDTAQVRDAWSLG